MVDEELHNYDEAVCKFFAVDRGNKQVCLYLRSIIMCRREFCNLLSTSSERILPSRKGKIIFREVRDVKYTVNLRK